MAERSFTKEVKELRLGEGETFRGEGILAITKALLQCGVSYIGGYQGAPISHLVDVMNDAKEIRDDYGVHFESCASEAGAAAMLCASIHYPMRGAVTWKSTVGTNVASDALANVASSGVTGGALVIIGEDYGEGSSIMQERSHAFAMKSQIWLLDPRPNLPSIVDAVESGFELSEASNTPVMLMVRIRACHVYGSFVAKDNVKAEINTQNGIQEAIYDTQRIVLPPASYLQEQDKLDNRWPAAVKYVTENKLNEVFDGDTDDVGIIVQGGIYNNLIRALELGGLADAFGNTKIPIYCMNVAYPMIPDEITAFCAGKSAVLMVEEGQPNYIEQALNTVLRQADINTKIHGKDMVAPAGELKSDLILKAVERFVETTQPAGLDMPHVSKTLTTHNDAVGASRGVLSFQVPGRPPGFCTGCPERPLFAAIKILEKELGPTHVCGDIGCNLFGALPPFQIGQHTMGYGLGLASSSGITPNFGKRVLTIMGDGGFWHNGLSTGFANAVFNKDDGVVCLVDNSYSAATGHQVVPSTGRNPRGEKVDMTIEAALRGVGVKWIRVVNNYDIDDMVGVLRDAFTTEKKGLKVVIARAECQLALQRRVKQETAKTLARGGRHVRTRFGVDDDVCTGDHACMRLSGCPSLTLKDSPDPLMVDPVAHIDNSCVGCGNCGSVVHEAGLCPSFFKAEVISNPNWFDRTVNKVRAGVISKLQGRRTAA